MSQLDLVWNGVVRQYHLVHFPFKLPISLHSQWSPNNITLPSTLRPLLRFKTSLSLHPHFDQFPFFPTTLYSLLPAAWTISPSHSLFRPPLVVYLSVSIITLLDLTKGGIHQKSMGQCISP